MKDRRLLDSARTIDGIIDALIRKIEDLEEENEKHVNEIDSLNEKISELEEEISNLKT